MKNSFRNTNAAVWNAFNNKFKIVSDDGHGRDVPAQFAELDHLLQTRPLKLPTIGISQTGLFVHDDTVDLSYTLVALTNLVEERNQILEQIISLFNPTLKTSLFEAKLADFLYGKIDYNNPVYQTNINIIVTVER